MTTEALQKEKTSLWKLTFYLGNAIGFVVALSNGWFANFFDHFLTSILWTFSNMFIFGCLAQVTWRATRNIKSSFKWVILFHTKKDEIKASKDFPSDAISFMKISLIAEALNIIFVILAIVFASIQVKNFTINEPEIYLWGWLTLVFIFCGYGVKFITKVFFEKLTNLPELLYKNSEERVKEESNSIYPRTYDEKPDRERLSQLTEYEKAVPLPFKSSAFPKRPEQQTHSNFPQRPASPFPRAGQPAFNDSDDINLG